MHPNTNYLLDLQNARKAVAEIKAAYQNKHAKIPDNTMTQQMIKVAADEWCVTEEMIKQLLWEEPSQVVELSVPLYQVPSNSIVRSQTEMCIGELNMYFNEFMVFDQKDSFVNCQYKNHMFLVDNTLMVTILVNGNNM